MATHATVSLAVHATLVANTVDTITFTPSGNTAEGEPSAVEVTNRTGTQEIYFTVDGSTPAIGGTNCWVVPAAIATKVVSGPVHEVKLISAGAMAYSVEGVRA